MESSSVNGTENPCTVVYRKDRWKLPDFSPWGIPLQYLYLNRFSELMFKKFFASKGINSLDYVDHLWQEDFKDYTGCEPETYRSDLLKYLDILDKFIDKKVLKYVELRMKECEVKIIKETEKPLNEAIPHEHEIKKSFKLQSKDVQINLVQAVDANLVVTESCEIESKNNSSENALRKLVNETQMQMQETTLAII
ncbi:hypothetical protein Tco_0569880 [Tanacetum coccineum]